MRRSLSLKCTFPWRKTYSAPSVKLTVACLLVERTLQVSIYLIESYLSQPNGHHYSTKCFIPEKYEPWGEPQTVLIKKTKETIRFCCCAAKIAWTCLFSRDHGLGNESGLDLGPSVQVTWWSCVGHELHNCIQAPGLAIHWWDTAASTAGI